MHRIPARRRVRLPCNRKSGAHYVRVVWGERLGDSWQKNGKTAQRFTMRNSNLQPTTRRASSISLGTRNTEVELPGPNNFRFAEPGG
jgi:hypothetical protein